MSKLEPVDTAIFEQKVLKSSLPVLVEFGAEWCAPCKRLIPELEQVQKELAGKALVAQVDVDQNAELVMQYGVMGVPTVILFANGTVIDRFSGYKPKTAILEMFEKGA